MVYVSVYFTVNGNKYRYSKLESHYNTVKSYFYNTLYFISFNIPNRFTCNSPLSL